MTRQLRVKCEQRSVITCLQLIFYCCSRRACISQAFHSAKERAFSTFRGIHEDALSARVTSLVNLKPGDFVIALQPTPSRGKVVLAQGNITIVSFIIAHANNGLFTVITMYTKTDAKGAKHEWIASTDQLGALSNISLQVFSPTGRGRFTSIACPDFGDSTFLHLPMTHIIFSLASFPIQVQPMPFELASSLISLCPTSQALFVSWQSQAEPLEAAVNQLQGFLRLKGDGISTD